MKTALQSPDTGTNPGKLQDEPRFALNALGEFVFYNHALANLLGLPAQADRTRLNAAKYLHFQRENPADEAPLGRRFMDQITAGSHVILCGNDQIPVRFQFDWVEGPNAQRYMVASVDNRDPVDVIRQIESTKIPSNTEDNVNASAQLRLE